MSQLDSDPPPLHLWSEAPARLPTPAQQLPFNTSSPRSPINQVIASHSPTSPNQPGLLIRDEFRRVVPKETKHALLSLTRPATLKCTGFPIAALLAVDEVISTQWSLGVSRRSETAESLRRSAAEDREGSHWQVELQGNVWKKKGHEELDTIRLLLAILTALGVHGWTIIEGIQAAGARKDSHNLLFAYSEETFSVPPLFFAISLPLPDRISIISPPARSTPALISAVRNSISSNSHKRTGTTSTSSSGSTDQASKRVTWNADTGKGVKLEGWVHQGVYRFWLDGMRRWLGGGVKKKVMENLLPQLLISIVNSLSSLHFNLAASIPLLPLAKGRDVLIFCSLPSSGLTYRDSFKPDLTEDITNDNLGSESPVLINMADGMPQAPPTQQLPTLPPRPNRQHHLNPVDPDFDREEAIQTTTGRPARALPWTPILAEGPPPLPPTDHNTAQQGFPPSSMPQTVAQPVGGRRSRTSSAGSDRRLIPSSAQSSPRPRNVLLKKNSLRRRGSASGNNSMRRHPSNASQQAARAEPVSALVADEEGWSMIEPPRQIGHLGLSNHDKTHTRVPSDGQGIAPPPSARELPNDQRLPINDFEYEMPMPGSDRTASPPISNPYQVRVRSLSITNPDLPHQPPLFPTNRVSTDSSGSVYHDSDNAPPPPLALGQPYHAEPLTVPLRDVGSPRRAGLVDVGSGIGVASMHGSVGYLGAPSVRSGYRASESGHGGVGGEVERGDDAASAVGSVSGGGKGNGTAGRGGIGSGRTRISIAPSN